MTIRNAAKIVNGSFATGVQINVAFNPEILGFT